jgi:integrase
MAQIFQRKDGRYVVRLHFGGTRIERTARTLADAQKIRDQLLRQQSLGALTAPTQITLAEWVVEWLRQREPNLRPSTLRTYRQVLQPVVALSGALRLDTLTPLALAKIFTELQRRVGRRRLQMAYTYLRCCLGTAVQLGILAANPLERVPRPRWEPKERPVWTPDEARRFFALALASPRRHSVLLAFLLGTGLRYSEAIALRWSDIDLDRQTVSVRRALIYVDSVPILQRPKSKMSERTISLPLSIIELLRRLPHPDGDAPVFLNRVGRAPDQNSVRKTLQELCKEASVPFIPIHSLRHTSATLLALSGLDVKSLQRRLGHSSPQLTFSVYAHAIDAGDRRAALILDEILGAH